MRAPALAIACLPLSCALALAGPMPVLPDLPPLPTQYQPVGQNGFYAGILIGPQVGSGIEDGLAAGIVIGNTMMAADLLLGAEVMASADMNDNGAVEASVRVGAPVSDSFAVFGSAGLGYDFDRDGFAVLGVAAEAEIGNGWAVRADYRLNLDFSGESASHRVLTGLVKRF